MLRLNLIRGGMYSGSEKSGLQVLRKVPPESFGHVQSAPLPPSLHPRLLERILGKSPLRLVVDRKQTAKGVWEEKLECGHSYTTYSQFTLENNRYIEVPITAVRRRCQPCKPSLAPTFTTNAEIAVARARQELIHKRRLQFGAMFDQLCFPNGELRPGPTEAELLAAFPSPKKPTQSVRDSAKRREA